ncbi:MAG: immunoglobulin domain-containing protein [Planctomycetes bacterium]|nr:immunoglobulin domain-containing protein [Planctomycetota bacterium]
MTLKEHVDQSIRNVVHGLKGGSWRGWVLAAGILGMAEGCTADVRTYCAILVSENVDGWNYEANALGCSSGTCNDGGASCRTTGTGMCSAHSPGGYPVRGLLQGLPDYVTVPDGHFVSRVEAAVYGSWANTDSRDVEIQVLDAEGGHVLARQTFTLSGSCGYKGNINITSLLTDALDRIGSQDELNIYWIGIKRTTVGSSGQDLYIDAFRLLVETNCFTYAVPAPSITDADACQGDTVTLSVPALPLINHTVGYQWQFNGAPIPGATSPQLTLSNVQPGQAGPYSCTISTACYSATSPSASLSVSTPVSIFTHPVSRTACEGDSFQLCVEPRGTGPYSYQWLKNGSVITGANSACLPLNSVTTAASGGYSCRVCNSCGGSPRCVESASATIVVNQPATASGPTPVTACQGALATFCVTPGGTSPFTYQWRKDGVDIPGANGQCLTMNSVQPAQMGNYSCRVCNTCGGSPRCYTTASAALTVLTPPVVLSGPTSRSVCEELATQLCVSANGSAPLHYEWRLNDVPIPGAPDSACYSDGFVQPPDGGSYSCRVYNVCGEAVSGHGVLTVLELARVALQPEDQTVVLGETATFCASATGDSPAFQWYRRCPGQADTAVPGANQACYSTPPVTQSDEGCCFFVRVSNSCGTADSSCARLFVSCGEWTPTTSAQNPPARSSAAMSWAGGSAAILFGGRSGSSVLADAWSLSSAGWSQLPAPPVPARAGHAMTLDSVRGVVVLFGGETATGTRLQDTWEFNVSTGVWTLRSSGGAGAPAARRGHTLTFDPALNRTVLFGGETTSTFRSDTWVWDGSTWTQLPQCNPAPPARRSHAATFDAARSELVMFGGRRSNGDRLGDTWVFDGQCWRIAGCGVGTAAPTPRFGHVLQWDPARGRAVLTGGDDGALRGDTWEWNGHAWSREFAEGEGAPPAASSACAAWTGGSLVYFSGQGASGLLNTVWAWVGPRAPTLVQEPTDTTALSSRRAVFACVADAAPGETGVPVFRWYRNGVPLTDDGRVSGSSDSILTITNVSEADEGAYSVVVSGRCASSNSRCAQLSVEPFCVGDYNQDGGWDGSDVQAFFDAWEISSDSADVNGDGGIDGDDIQCFFIAWEVSGCACR